MWQEPRFLDDPFTSPTAEPTPSAIFSWARRKTQAPRFSGLRLTPLRAVIVLVLLGIVSVLRGGVLPVDSNISIPDRDISNIIVVPQAAFKPPEDGRYRDTFRSYKYRNPCNVSSLDLHAPFSPLCLDRSSMLTAMSSGGRIGQDAPYMPRGCDMRWFTTDEVCQILGKFDKVILVGDSMLRHIIGSLNILIRKDLGYGAVTDWNFSSQERKECFCNEQFDVRACSVQGIYKTADVVIHDPDSLTCSNNINVIMEEIVSFPIPDTEMLQIKDIIQCSKNCNVVFIFGHGLWSDLDLRKTVNWLDAILHTITEVRGTSWHGLFVTPNASGKEKPDEHITTQGNKALMLFEEVVGIEAAKRGVEHLGTWNMSIQSTKYDGTHLDMRGNLVKPMMVLNWLNLLEEQDSM